MLKFVDSTTSTLQPLQSEYDTVLVLLSYLIAAFATYGAAGMSSRLQAADGLRAKALWLLFGSVILGTGIWTMHFIGMLAYRLPLPVSYDVVTTALSILPAILASAIVMFMLKGAGPTRIAIGIASLVLGAGIGAMHYSGMAAMRLEAEMRFVPAIFALSIIVAVGLSFIALTVQAGTRTRPLHSRVVWEVANALLMGAAITAMHYTGMAAVRFFPAGPHVTPMATGVLELRFDEHLMVITVAAISALLILMGLGASFADKRIQRAVEAARVSRLHFADAIEHIPDGFVYFFGDKGLLLQNGVFRNMHVGMKEDIQPGLSYRDFQRLVGRRMESEGGDAGNGDQTLADEMPAKGRDAELPDGRVVHIKENRTDAGGLVSIWTDITARKRMEESLAHTARHDGLTGLPNRTFFHDRLEHAAAVALRSGGSIALLYVDLDKFKPINDSLGHQAGDAVLQEVAARLKACVRNSDTVARLGGDEFAVLLEPRADREATVTAARRILKSFGQPIDYQGQQCTVGASIGIGMLPADSRDVEHLVHIADEAMYRVKEAGRNDFAFFADTGGDATDS